MNFKFKFIAFSSAAIISGIAVSAQNPVYTQIEIVEPESCQELQPIEEEPDAVLIQSVANTVNVVQPNETTNEDVYSNPDVSPVFPGGQAAFAQWLSYNVKYPIPAVENNIQGKVVIKCIVEKDGSITNPVILKGVNKDLDKEAIRVARRMPKWCPGSVKNVPVRSYVTFPINFRLQ